MVAVNKRTRTPQAFKINGIDNGGAMTAEIEMGFDQRLRSSPDGLQVPLQDKYTEYVRGRITTQDWSTAIGILTGTVGTLVFYERNSAVAEATGYTSYTITAPIVHRIGLSLRKDGYATATYEFECLAADETKGIDDMFVPLPAQAAPTYIPAARGGYRVASAVYSTLTSAVNIYHVTSFDFTLATRLLKESNDGDVGYTCVEAVLDGLEANGSLAFQDMEAAGTPVLLKAQQLLIAARDQLVLTITQGGGGAAKTLTLLGVDFDHIGGRSNSDGYTEQTIDFQITNDVTTQLTVAGTNTIIAVA